MTIDRWMNEWKEGKNVKERRRDERKDSRREGACE